MEKQQDDVLAAHVLITLLRSTVLDFTETDAPGVRLNHSQDTLSDEAAAALLANRARPLACSATSLDGVLHITCDPISAAEIEQRNGGSILTESLGQHALRTDPKIRISARGNDLIVPSTAFTAFEQQYSIDAAYILLTHTPKLSDRIRGIKLAVQVSSADNLQHRTRGTGRD